MTHSSLEFKKKGGEENLRNSPFREQFFSAYDKGSAKITCS